MNVTQLRAHLITCDDDALPHFRQRQRPNTPEAEDSGHRSGHFQQSQGFSLSGMDGSNTSPSHLQDNQALSLSVLEYSDDMELPDIENNISKDKGIAEIVEKVVKVCSHWSNPVEILKYLQSCLIVGRDLEVEDVTETAEGKTNHICIDRDNILETAFDEIQHIENMRITLEVDFYGESVSDLVGPQI
ncbi:hypothetical protein KP79_PYT22378 [Mizuhopecten yessoensis]|uniref:Uncharacterized protein n=1 Tax=Mizuhopecten yessoensis TaxID=6573 RepID=A0A210Q5I1_MIZYE|nr:hypothetical protein KP79_PYT22378 [Mizuhopecten yessoensis]